MDHSGLPVGELCSDIFRNVLKIVPVGQLDKEVMAILAVVVVPEEHVRDGAEIYCRRPAPLLVQPKYAHKHDGISFALFFCLGKF